MNTGSSRSVATCRYVPPNRGRDCAGQTQPKCRCWKSAPRHSSRKFHPRSRKAAAPAQRKPAVCGISGLPPADCLQRSFPRQDQKPQERCSRAVAGCAADMSSQPMSKATTISAIGPAIGIAQRQYAVQHIALHGRTEALRRDGKSVLPDCALPPRPGANVAFRGGRCRGGAKDSSLRVDAVKIGEVKHALQCIRERLREQPAPAARTCGWLASARTTCSPEAKTLSSWAALACALSIMLSRTSLASRSTRSIPWITLMAATGASQIVIQNRNRRRRGLAG